MVSPEWQCEVGGQRQKASSAFRLFSGSDHADARPIAGRWACHLCNIL